MKHTLHTWRAVLCHVVMVGSQPLYFALRYDLTPAYYQNVSKTWLAVCALIWLWIFTRITLPFYRTSALQATIPSPPTDRLPFGHLHLLRERPPTERLLKLYRDTPNNGLVGIWDPLYLRCRLFPTTPEAIMEVLNSRSYDYEKPKPAKKLLSRVLGNGLINAEGNAHKGMRRIVAPAFSGKHIRDLAPIMWKKGLDFADSMVRESRKSADGSVEMMGRMSRVTLDLIGAAGIGMDFNTINSDENKLAKLYAIITATNRGSPFLFLMITAFVHPWITRRLRGTIYARIANATLELRKSVAELLAEKKRAMELKTADQKDIIAVIMRSGNYSDEFLTDQLLTFLAAGHDTTASALTFCTWLLSLHPEVQYRLRKECQDQLRNKTEDEVTADDFDNMPYLTSVCNETIRLYPTVPVTARHAIVDTKIGDYVIPKGSMVHIAPWATNRLPALWGEDADKFNPDRWLDGPLAATGGAPSVHALITFLHGPRSCIGQSFARMEMKCLLAALIMRFQLEVADPTAEVKVSGFITIKPEGGIRLKLHDLTEKPDRKTSEQ